MTEMRELDILESPLEGTNLIEASAGTGKTYTITGLVLRLILEADVLISEILVVTYTEAATSELKDRIRRRLREAAEAFSGSKTRDALVKTLLENHPNRESALRKLNCALSDFDQASIFTIHAFCLRTLLDHAFASGILFDTELVTDEQNLVREVVRDFWRKHFYGASHLFFNYARNSLSLKRLRSLANRNVFNPYLKIVPEKIAPDCSNLEAEFLREFERVHKGWLEEKDAVRSILSESPSLNRSKYKAGRVPGWVRSMDAYLAGECLSCTPDDSFLKFTRSSIEGAIKKGGTPPSNPFFDLCEGFAQISGKLQAAYDERVLGLKVEFLYDLRKELEKRKTDKNILFFDDLLVKLDRALVEPRGDHLAEAIRGRFKAALIDEFQDTDSIQYSIFRKIFGTDGSTLFLIGDPKQAIYGFRGADVFTYMDASRNASAGFTLGENWRSQPNLIQAVNVLFSNVEPAFVYEEIVFSPVKAPAGKPPEFLEIDEQSAAPLQIWFLRSAGLSGEKLIPKGKARDLIVNAVAAEISSLLSLGRRGKALMGDRPVREGDIAVLVRANFEARMVQLALTKLGIHAVLYNMGNLFDTPEATEVARLLAAVMNPTDERLLRGALATEMLGVSGEELDRLMRDELGWESRLIRFGEYHELWARYGFFKMFRHLLSKEGVLPRLMSLVDGERRCTNVLHLSEVLHQNAMQNNLDMLGLVKWLSIQRDEEAQEIEEHQLRLESDENAVKLVTIHKSKGLEYPIVFCPFTWEGSRLRGGDDPFVFHDESNEKRLTLDLGSPEKESHRLLAEKERLAENLRLLYVAVTRAKHRCYLVWGRFNGADTSAPAYLLHPSVSKDWDGSLSSMEESFRALNDDSMWSDLEGIRERTEGAIALFEMPAGEGEARLPVEGAAEKLDARPFGALIRRDWGISSFSSLIFNQPHKAEQADRDEVLLPEPPPEVDYGEPGAAEAKLDIFSFPKGAASGIVLHRIFERLDFTDCDDGRLGELVSKELEEQGFDAVWTDPVCRMLRNVLTIPLASPFEDFSLSRVPNEKRLNELEFYFPLKHLSESRLKEILIRYVGGGGEAHVVDIKKVLLAPTVTPAKAGVQKRLERLDSDFRRNDAQGLQISTREPESTALGGEPAGHSNLERLQLDSLEGFMKGFMDLVFQHTDRFYIVDWKSNFLGPKVQDYGQEALKRAVRENFYNLQYTLYTVALHLYLKARLPGYDYESHFGGVYYIFLRGVDPAFGSAYGIFADRPHRASIEALALNLIGKEG